MEIVMDAKKVAEQFDIISEACERLAGMFRGGGSDAGSASVDGKASKPVRGRKPAPAEQDEGVDVDTVREALKELMELRGKEVMVQALESVGAGKLADVDESQYQELIDKANELKEEPANPPEPTKTTKPTRGRKAKAGPTLEQVTEAAKALIDADKPAYLKLTKKLGKPSEMEESDYAAAIEAYEGAMPADEGDEEELL